MAFRSSSGRLLPVQRASTHSHWRLAVPTREQLYWKYVLLDKERRQAQKNAPAQQREKPVRRRDWIADYDDDDAVETVSMPRSETRASDTRPKKPAIRERDVPSHDPAGHPVHELSRGRVVEVSSGSCRVSIRDEVLLCGYRGTLRDEISGQLNLVAAGDEVLVSTQGVQFGTVESILPRRSALTRPEVHYGHLEQVIAANIDQLLIVASWREPALWPELLDRYLIAAQRYNLEPIICVNKVDLAEEGTDPRDELLPYDQAGYQVILTSVLSGEGIERLRTVLSGRTTALAGLSGVGKSSLLSAAFPGLDLKISSVSDRRHEGRHTTTQATLHRIGDGGFVVDTPGIREFGLSRLAQRELAGYYPELAPIASECQYANCLHVHEQGCAVRAGVREGRISRMRYTNYRKILASLGE